MPKGQGQRSTRADDAETQIAASFVTENASEIHEAFGGSARYNDETGHFEAPTQYKALSVALQEYVLSNDLSMGLVLGPNASESSWDALFEKVNDAEARLHGTEKRPLEIFKKMWLKVGENQAVIDPWLSLIPDSYGLAVVRSAIAIILKIAQKSADARQKIFDTFKKIRDTIGEANSKRKSFQTDVDVSRCAAALHESIVDAIEKMFQLLPSPKQPFQWNKSLFKMSKHKKREKVEKVDPDEVLEKVEASALELVRAVDRRRDDILARTGQVTQDTNSQVTMIMGWIVTEADIGIKETRKVVGEVQIQVGDVATDVKDGVCLLRDIRDGQHTYFRLNREESSKTTRMERTIQVIQQGMDRLMMDDRQVATDELLALLLEERKKNTMLKRRNKALRQRQIGDTSSPAATTAVVTVEQLVEIICRPRNGGQDVDMDMESVVDALHENLERVIRLRSRMSVHAQGQAQSLLHQARFLAWLERQHPDLISVDGNIPSSVRDAVSAMSLFCAIFVLSLSKLEPDSVMVHFFCGLHPSPRDAWCGPSGLIRLLIVQLLAALDDEDLLRLSFLNRRSQIRRLEEHSLRALCELFHQLLRQFPPSKTVYCIVDGVSLLDSGEFTDDLGVVLGALESIVRDDDELRVVFKVMLTVSGRSSLRLRRRVSGSRCINLSPRDSNARPMTQRWLDAAISRPSTPLGRSVSRGRRSVSCSRRVSVEREEGQREEEQDDDDDDDDDNSEVSSA
ncbi:hypothetical protein JDV02_008080 [Purpureocillium takamizusanense]|uniref:Fungal STAND N-terminal Goodbye domain-containing protein n=1 Tax=Purpureocillium takamizusanense TaxID=2060973 RepID=A0A9Q8QN17_9HYPO|nr:uncharacterized protein JDV02_008080 [Purpureocillium takamizusanense]UNI22166.1 hypothetical protein JDV02_008080 [Purpureocillium takamizusanense]